MATRSKISGARYRRLRNDPTRTPRKHEQTEKKKNTSKQGKKKTFCRYSATLQMGCKSRSNFGGNRQPVVGSVLADLRSMAPLVCLRHEDVIGPPALYSCGRNRLTRFTT